MLGSSGSLFRSDFVPFYQLKAWDRPPNDSLYAAAPYPSEKIN